MGKYHSTASNSDAFANTSGFGLANVDIVGFAFWFAGGITFSDIRVSDREPVTGHMISVAAPHGFEP